jgi:hypothetical protein
LSSAAWCTVLTAAPSWPDRRSTSPSAFDSSFQEREGRFAEEKRRIGFAAAELIREHETVGLHGWNHNDSGGAMHPPSQRHSRHHQCSEHRHGA